MMMMSDKTFLYQLPIMMKRIMMNIMMTGRPLLCKIMMMIMMIMTMADKTFPYELMIMMMKKTMIKKADKVFFA